MLDPIPYGQRRGHNAQKSNDLETNENLSSRHLPLGTYKTIREAKSAVKTAFIFLPLMLASL